MSTIEPGEDEGSGHTSKHNILTIPLELFERIAEVAEPRSLLNIRQVNREAAANILRIYTAVHFTKRAFLICNENSLETLIAIAQHDIFGKSMTDVYLCVDAIAHGDDPAIAKRKSEVRPLWDTTQGRPARQRTLLLQRLEQWCKLSEAQGKFRFRNGDLYALIVAFSHFRRNGNIVNVWITDQARAAMRANEADALELLSGEKLTTSGDDTQSILSVLEALAVADFPAKNLSICPDIQAWNMHMFGDDSRTNQYARSAFRRLEHLNIVSDHYEEDDPTTIEEAKQSVALFASPVNLKILAVGGNLPYNAEEGEPAPNDEFMSALLDQNFPSLERLDLEGFVLPLQHLVAFMHRHEKLKAANFSNCRFHSFNGLDDGLTALSHMPTGFIEEVMHEATGRRVLVCSRYSYVW